MTQVHATCIAFDDDHAVLLIGPPGSGKSDLALRLIDSGATLVADDRVDLERRDDRLIATPPREIAGLLEVRGLGIARLDYKGEAPVVLVFEMAGADKIERLPQPATWAAAGVTLPAIRLDPFAAAAPAKVRLAVENLRRDILIDPE